MSAVRPESGVSERVPFPRYSIGLLQSESEMLQAPGHDLLPFLAAETDLWTVELFTERTVHALLDATDRFDCVVVGYNAAYKSPDIRAALEAWTPDVGVCVLHQLDPAALGFLRSLEAGRLREPEGPPSVATGREPHDEILLNWPETVALAQAGRLPDSHAYVYVQPTDGSWRTVLELDLPSRRLPVLVRTHSGIAPPLAVCTTLLAPRSHAKLLTNLMLWCAAGRPAAVVVETVADAGAAAIQRKLRMQGTRAIVERVAERSELSFRRWPFWGVGDVVLPHGWDPGEAATASGDDALELRPWLRRGGRIVVLGPGDSLTIRHGESDAHWVTKRWAAWFNGVPAEVWHGGGEKGAGSIVASRSILRMLSTLHRSVPEPALPGQTAVAAVLERLSAQGVDIDPVSLGLPEPLEFAEPVAALLRHRIGDGDNIERSVSATVAALDIDALLGHEALDAGRRRRVKEWLTANRKAFATTDRLEIARCFGSESLLLEMGDPADPDLGFRAPASASLVTALRTAIVACRSTPEGIARFPMDVERQVVERELPMRPMLAANYILGVLDLRVAWPEPVERQPGHSLQNPPEERIDQAVVTLGRYGPLARGHAGSSAPVPELASVEALALIAYFAREPVPTHVLRREEAIAAPMVDAILEESAKTRRENQSLVAHKRVLDWAGPALAVAAELLVLEIVALIWLLVLTKLPIGLQLTFGGLLFVLLTLALLAGLERFGLTLKAGEQIAGLLSDGFGGVKKLLADAVTRPPPDR